MPIARYVRSVLIDKHEDGSFAGATAIYARVLRDDDGKNIEALKEENVPIKDEAELATLIGDVAAAHITKNEQLEEQLAQERKSAQDAYDALKTQGEKALADQAKEHEAALEEMTKLGLQAVADIEGQIEAKLSAKDSEIAAMALERDLAKEKASTLETLLAQQKETV